jgi:hypothetical protein
MRLYARWQLTTLWPDCSRDASVDVLRCDKWSGMRLRHTRDNVERK